jgi:4-diphosphocytidyl-2C-methyl-D-erythritol kinase
VELYNIGAIYAAMSGSGSSFFGIFKKENMNEIKNLVSTETRFKKYKLFFTEQL